MIVNIASLPGSAERPNEDWAGATLNTVVVLDGVTAPATNGHGCHHSVPWFVGNLGTLLLMLLETGGSDMSTALAQAIDQVADLHRDTCDLKHPGTPAAAVAALRRTGDTLEWLVLSDVTVVLDIGGDIRAVTDNRVDQVAREARDNALKHRIGSAAHKAAVAHMSREQLKYRNVPDGYWVAAGDRQAAYEAITGSAAVDQVRHGMLLTDGASWVTTGMGSLSWTWNRYLDYARSNGPIGALLMVRDMEARDPDGDRYPRYKRSDDATLAVIRRSMSATEVHELTKPPTGPGAEWR